MHTLYSCACNTCTCLWQFSQISDLLNENSNEHKFILMKSHINNIKFSLMSFFSSNHVLFIVRTMKKLLFQSFSHLSCTFNLSLYTQSFISNATEDSDQGMTYCFLQCMFLIESTQHSVLPVDNNVCPSCYSFKIRIFLLSILVLAPITLYQM